MQPQLDAPARNRLEAVLVQRGGLPSAAAGGEGATADQPEGQAAAGAFRGLGAGDRGEICELGGPADEECFLLISARACEGGVGWRLMWGECVRRKAQSKRVKR